MTAGERDLIARWIRAGAPKQAVTAVAGKPVADGGGGEGAGGSDPRYATVQSCTGCHGVPPAGPGDATIPRLAGQNFEYISRRLTLFKHSDPWDQSSPMNKIAFGLSGEDIRATAEAFAAAPGLNVEPPDLAPERQHLYKRGAYLAREQCVMCHMNADMGGHPNDQMIPVLAGQNEDYVKGQLYAFRSGARKSKGMYEYASPLTDYDIESLAVYFAQARVKAAGAH
jgi:cytochrome c553